MAEPPAQSPNYEGKIATVKLQDIGSLIKRLNYQVQHDALKLGNTAKNAEAGFLLDEDNIHRIESTSGHVNYSIYMQLEAGNPKSFYNLIIPVDSIGQQGRAYVNEYRCNDDSWEAYKASNFDILSFKGKIYRSWYDGAALNSKGKATLAKDPCPDPDPDDFDPTGPGDGGGDSSNTGGGGSGGNTFDGGGYGLGNGVSGGSIPVVCNNRFYWHNCGGTNGNIMHGGGDDCGGKNTTGSGWVMVTTCSDGSVKKTQLFKNEGCPEDKEDIVILPAYNLYAKYIKANSIGLSDADKEKIDHYSIPFLKKLYKTLTDDDATEATKKHVSTAIKIVNATASVNDITSEVEANVVLDLFVQLSGDLNTNIFQPFQSTLSSIDFGVLHMGEKLGSIQCMATIYSIANKEKYAKQGTTSYKDFDLADQKIIAKNAVAVTTIVQIKTTLGSIWPQTEQEWAVIADLFVQFLPELAIGFIPGSAIIDVFKGAEQGDILAVTLGIAAVIVDFAGGKILNILADTAKTVYKVFKIFKLAEKFLAPLQKILQKGFKIDLDGVLKLKNKSGDVIASGDVVQDMAKALSKVENLPYAKKLLENGADADFIKRINNLSANQLSQLDNLIKNQKKPAGFNGKANFTATKMINGKQVSVKYDKNGFPDFTPHASSPNHVFKSDNLKGASVDMTAANKWAKENLSGNIQTNGTRITIDGVPHTWHHHQDGKSMFPVPSKIHNANDGGFNHSGGAAIINRGLKGLFGSPKF
ncbi:MAG: HNH endonuclease [Flavobacteriaceae bacterium]|nr:HNH endonuclease [Flavobacteriaceae bacterium]